MTNLSDIEKRCEACPFCGDDNLSVVEMTYMHADGPTKGQRIKCQTCGAQAPDTAWNLRAQVQDLQSKLATAEGLVALQQEQIGGMQRKVTHEVDKTLGLQAEFIELHQKVAELEADAKRVNWLERLFEKRWNAVIDGGSRTYWYIWSGYRHLTSKMEGKTFREAIDAALNTETTR